MSAVAERLDAVTEQELLVRYRESGDLPARDRLVAAYQRLVWSLARRYGGYGLAAEDLAQEGMVGLLKAIDRFDTSLGLRLGTYAAHWIRAEIHEFIIRHARLVRPAVTKAQRKLFFAKSRLRDVDGALADAGALAADLDVPEQVVREMQDRLGGADVPLHAEGDGVGPADYLAAEGADPAALVEGADFEAHQLSGLHLALAALDERDRAIVQRRWLADPCWTLQQVADELGVSAERVRQLELRALRRMRETLSTDLPREARMKETTLPAVPPAPSAKTDSAFDFGSLPFAERRRLILVALQEAGEPLSSKDLRAHLGAAGNPDFWGPVQAMQRHGVLARTSDGKFALSEKGEARADEAAAAMSASPAEPPRAAARPVVELAQASAPRAALTSDGCLLIWSGGSGEPVEVDSETTLSIRRLLRGLAEEDVA